MSVSALTWAFAQEIRPDSHKFVLVAMADYCNEEWEAYPSIAALEAKTCIERRGLFRAIADLKSRGFIEATGERKGSTKQIHVYRLKGCQNGNALAKGDKMVTVTKMTLKGDKNAPLKGCQNGNTEPSILFNRQEPLFPPTPQKGDVLAAFEQFWAEILPANRKGKGRAREEFQKALKNGTDVDDILAGISSFRKVERKRSHQNDYRPLLPATWLHQARWEDDIVIEQENGENEQGWIDKSIYG